MRKFEVEYIVEGTINRHNLAIDCTVWESEEQVFNGIEYFLSRYFPGGGLSLIGMAEYESR